MTEQEYNIMLNYLNSCELDEDGKIYEEDCLEAAGKLVLPDILDKYFRNREIKFDDTKELLKNYIDEFIQRLNPNGLGKDSKFSSLLMSYNDPNTRKKETINKPASDFEVEFVKEQVEKLTSKEYIEKAAINQFSEKFKSGETLSEIEKDKFFNIRIDKTLGSTNNIFKNIFDVKESDEELEALKKTNENEYKEKSKGNKELDNVNIKTALASYKLLTDKVKKTSFLDMLFHLPSYFKMKKNAKNMKEQMVNKGINEKLIDEYENEKVTSVKAFERNKYYNNEITKEEFDLALNPKKEEKGKVINSVERKLLDKAKNLEEGAESKKEEVIPKDKTTEIDDIAKNIKATINKAESKKSTIKKNPEKAEQYRLKYNDVTLKIKELKDEIETKNKNIEKFNKELNDKRENKNKKVSEAQNIINELYEKGLDDDDIRKISALNPDDPKHEKQKDVILKCVDVIERRRELNELQNDIYKDEEKQKTINSRAQARNNKMNGLLGEQKLYLSKYKKYAGIVEKKKQNQNGEKVNTESKLGELDLIEAKKEDVKVNKDEIEKVKAIKVTSHDDLNQKFEVVNEEDEEEIEDETYEEINEETEKEDFYSKLKNDTSGITNDEDELSKPVEAKTNIKEKNIEIE